MTARMFVLTAFLAAAVAAGAAELPVLTVELGEENRSAGLTVPSAGDGENRPAVVGEIPCRRIAPESNYLYVRVDDPGYAATAPVDLYVTVEIADDRFNRVGLQYERDADAPTLETRYTQAEGAVVLLGKGGLRTAHFLLPDAGVGHGQNHGTDFRLNARDLAVHRITVSTAKPEGYRVARGIDDESLKELAVLRPPGMELTIGSDADDTDAAIYRALGVTSVESYVHWAGVEGKEEGVWDWSRWDKQADVLRRHGLKWVPFLIAGPAYATPLWFQEGDESVYFKCLEHGTEGKVQSIFSPAWPPYVERFLEAFAERYEGTGVIESVLLGVTGIYGESIYPAGPEGGWTAGLTGTYHNHGGWWAGDVYAAEAFRKAMRRQYRFLFLLNRAWGTEHGTWDSVSPFLPGDAPNDRARSDMARWYQEAMTEWSVLWVEAARRVFPETEIYLCTGGSGNPFLGADFTAQAKAIEPYGAGIRITNEGSDLALNFTVTREVATATARYGTFAGFEPAGTVDENGVTARIFNATASGVRQLHYYQPNLLQSAAALDAFRRNVPLLVPRTPDVRTAFYVSRETWEVDPAAVNGMYDHARLLRDLTDFDMVTRQTVADGILKKHRALVLVDSPVLDPGAAREISRWVSAGGILVAASRPGSEPGSRLENVERWRRMLPEPGQNPAALLGYEPAGDIPDAWTLEIGSGDDEGWLFGDWSHRENAAEWPDTPNARKRWSGAEPGIRLPVRPGAPYRLRLDAHLSGYSLKPVGNTVLVNGIPVGRLDTAGPAAYDFTIPAEVLGEGRLAELKIRMNTWVPADYGGSSDDRELGVALHRVTLVRQGAAGKAPAPVRLAATLDETRLPAFLKAVGKGHVLYLPDVGAEPGIAAAILGVFLRETDRFLPGVDPLAAQDGLADGIYTAVMTDGTVLRYDSAASEIAVER